MAKTHTIHARHIICAKLKSEWEQSANANLVPLKGEFCLEINDTELAKQNPDLNEVFKLKIGDGTSKYSELPYLFTTKTEIINLITTEINKLDVAGYAQATYNSSTKQLVIKGIKEVDGKISDDSTNNVTVDLSPSAIAPIQSVTGDGKWISTSLSGTTVTVSHIGPDTTSTSGATATAGSNVDWEDAVVTGVTIDAKGHVTGVTTGNIPDNPVGDVAEHSENDTDKGITVEVTTENGSVKAVDVSVSNSDLIAGGVIDDGIAVTNPWISKSTNNNTKVVTLAHTDPSTEDSKKSITETEKGTGILTGISIDAKGHVRTMPDTKTLSVGDKLTFGTVDSSTIQIGHLTTARTDDAQSGNMSFGTAVVTGVTTDTTGHVTGITTKAIPTDPTDIAEHSETDTDKGVSVTVTTEDAEVSGVTVAVDTTTLAQELGLSGAMHLIGESTTAITEGGHESPTIDGSVVSTLHAGDVVLYNSLEFVWVEDSSAYGGHWVKYGDEGSYALKTRSISAGSELSGGGTLEADRTINHEEKLGSTKAGSYGPTQTSATTLTDGTTVKIPKFTVNAYGHITDVNEITFTAEDQHVDSAAHHYTPSTDSSSTINLDAGGATAADNIDVVTGITVSRDSKGHVTDITIDSGKVVSVGNGELSIQANGTEAIDFTANQFGDETLNIKGDGQGSGATGAIEVTTPSVNNISVSAKTATTSQKGVTTLVDTYTSSNNTDNTNATTNKSIKAAVDLLDVNSAKGTLSIDSTNKKLNFKGIIETDGLIDTSSINTDSIDLKDIAPVQDVTINSTSILDSTDNTAKIAVDGTYNSSTNKIATESTVTDAIEALDGNATTVDDTSSSLDVINTVSETDGVISSTKKTLAEGTSGKITITAPTSGTNAGKIVIDHANTTPVYEQNTVSTTGYNTPKETDTLVVTGIVTDYGHVSRVKVEPSTNLIAADIKAPVTRTDDSIWNYRETGGEISVGEDTARIPSLKGNTLVWNQLVQNGNFESTSGWITSSGADFSTNDNVATFTATAKYGGLFHYCKLPENQLFLAICEVKTTAVEGEIKINFIGDNPKFDVASSSTSLIADWQTISGISSGCGGSNGGAIRITDFRSSNRDAIQVRNVRVFNLTKMFGAGNEPTTVEEFERLFPNSYYPYCEGRLVNLGGYGVKMNQLVQNGNFASTDNWTIFPYTTMDVANNECTIGATNSSSTNILIAQSVTSVEGHTYYFGVDIKATAAINAIFGMSDDNGYGGQAMVQKEVSVTTTYARYSLIGRVSDVTKNTKFILRRYTAGTETINVKNFICVDLTLMFGPGSEPTLEEFEAMFPEDYYEYDAGTEMNIFDAIGDKKLGLESTGFNQWDEQTKLGYYDQAGQYVSSYTARICSANLIPIISGKTYCISAPNNIGGYIGVSQYDKRKNFIVYDASNVFPWSFTVRDNCAYINLNIPQSYGTTYNHDICINLSSSRNGEYEPYKSDTLDLDWIRNEGVKNFNIWDEEWENVWDAEFSSNRIKSKNYIPVRENTTYYFVNKGEDAYINLDYYDSQKVKIGSAPSSTIHNGTTFQTPSGCAYIMFGISAYYYGPTYNHDICINISNPALNGEYHPYGVKAKYFPQGLLSAGSVYDEVQEGKLIKRVGVVDLGTVNWGLSPQGNFFIGDNSVNAPLGTYNAMCAKYSNITAVTNTAITGGLDKAIGFNAVPNIRLVDSDLTISNISSELSGVMLYYELATPIEIPLDEPRRMSYVVDDHGTEQQLPINVSSVINAPFRGTFEYYSNFKEAVLDLLKIKGGRAINIDANYEVSAKITNDLENDHPDDKLISAAQAWVELNERNVHADIVSAVTSGTIVVTENTITGTAAPSTAPTRIGQQYIKTSSPRKVYIAVGTSSSSDWLQVGSE